MDSLKKKLASSIITIAGAASLIAFGLSSFAWYSSNKEDFANGINLKVSIDSNMVNIDFKLYKYDHDKKAGVESLQGSEGFNLDLNEFDNFIRERNINNNNIICFHAALPNSQASQLEKRKLTVTAQIDTTVIGETFSGGFTDRITRTYADETGYKYHRAGTTTNYTCNNISNIIYFKGFASSYIVDGVLKPTSVENEIDLEADADTIYKKATNIFASMDQEYTFVNGNSKDREITFSLSEIDAKASDVYFFVEYNYNANLVDAFLANTEIVGSQDVGMLKAAINFNKDIQSIIISSSEVN